MHVFWISFIYTALFSLCLIGQSCHFKDRWCDYRKWLFSFLFLSLAHSSSLWSPWDCSAAIRLFFSVFFPYRPRCLRYPFITQMPRWRWLLRTPQNNVPARKSVTELLTDGRGSNCHLCFTCRPRLLPEDVCKAIIVCALVDPVNNWLYWLSAMASAPRRDREGRRRGGRITVTLITWRS